MPRPRKLTGRKPTQVNLTPCCSVAGSVDVVAPHSEFVVEAVEVAKAGTRL